MGPDRYRIQDPKAPHFLTATVVQRLPLFSRPYPARRAGLTFGEVGYRVYAPVYPVPLGTLCPFGGYLIFRRSDLS